MSHTKSETDIRKRKKQKKELIIGISLIGIALFGTFGFFEIMKAALHTQIPMVVVTSDSMVPTINRGDLLIVGNKAPIDIKDGTIDNKTGDIIIYDASGVWPDSLASQLNGEPVVHRVVGKYLNQTDGLYYFITKGDNNDCPDPPYCLSVIPVPETHILGVVQTIIPKIGWVKIWLTEGGLAIPIIVILGFLLVISIVYDITHPEKEKDEKEKEIENLEKMTEDGQKNIDMGL